MGLHKDEAVVLRQWTYGENAVILSLLTRNLGRVRAVAKGVKKPQSRLRSSVQPLTRGDFVFYLGHGSLFTVTQATATDVFPGLRADLLRMSSAQYAAEAMESLWPEGDPGSEGFLFLASVLKQFELGDVEMTTRWFEVNALRLQGLFPLVDCCSACGGTVAGVKSLSFSFSQGGVLCPSCHGDHADVFEVSRMVLAVMTALAKTKLQHLPRLKVSPGVKHHLEMILTGFLQYRAEKEFKSLSFMRRLERRGDGSSVF